jgi:ribosomal protein S18 acetylase RimI-like enzyme
VAAEIRPCRPDEAGAVLRLWDGARSEHAVTEDTPERVAPLIDTGALLVAVEDGAVVGAVIVGFDGWRGNFYRLAVAPSHRRRGIGRRLVAAGEERLRALGAPRVTALVAFDDEDAGGFWEAVGYPRDPVMGRRVRTLDRTAAG